MEKIFLKNRKPLDTLGQVVDIKNREQNVYFAEWNDMGELNWIKRQ